MPSPSSVEITSAVELANADGTLNCSAVGFARGPVHQSTHLPHGAYWAWRTKLWEYWGIVSPELAVGLTVADLDYVAVMQSHVHDRATGQTINGEALRPRVVSDVELPTGLPPFTSGASVWGMSLEFKEDTKTNRTTLTLRSPHVSADLVVDTSSEALGVVVPWSDTRFQYTLKSPGLPVTGTVVVDGREIRLEKDAWATLDRGRGRWPYNNKWNWATASGVTTTGHRIGLNLGAQWTDGSGTTENAIIIDGVLDGPPRDDAVWEFDPAHPEKPWRIKGSWIDATMTPWHVRVAKSDTLVVTSNTVQCFGDWTGHVVLHDGTRVGLEGLVGWAEDVYNRW